MLISHLPADQGFIGFDGSLKVGPFLILKGQPDAMEFERLLDEFLIEVVASAWEDSGAPAVAMIGPISCSREAVYMRRKLIEYVNHLTTGATT